MKNYLTVLVGVILLFGSCKKELLKRDTKNTKIFRGNALTIGKVKSFVEKSAPKRLKINKLSSLNAVQSNNQGYPADAAFAWEYATTENILDGFPAVLVPIYLTESLNFTFDPLVSTTGYRVAVFQETPDKSSIMVGFRDYHPNKQFILDKMREKNISTYPSNFLEFDYLVNGEFNGTVICLNASLIPTKFIKVANNKPEEYLDLPHFLSDGTIEPNPQSDIIGISNEYTPCEQEQIQILYPEYQDQLVSVHYSYYPTNIVASWDKVSKTWALPTLVKGIYTYLQTNVTWKSTTLLGNGGCTLIMNNNIDYSPNPYIDILDCDRLRKIAAALNASLNKFNIIKTLDKNKEAGYTLVLKDLSKPNELTATPVIPGDERGVDLPRSWNPSDGYTVAQSHYHPGSLPPSFADVLNIVGNYGKINKQAEQLFFVNNYISFVETNSKTVYAVMIKDMDKLVAISKLKTIDAFMVEEWKKRDKMVDEEEYIDYEAAELLLLQTFADAVHLYKGKRDRNNNVKFKEMVLPKDKDGRPKGYTNEIDFKCN